MTVDRGRVVAVGRWVFLAAVVAATVVAFHGHGREVLDAISATPWWAVVLASCLVVVGLVLTSVAWRALLRGYGYELPGRDARSVFFVGQLGKYVPGGVWSIGAQAHLAAAYDVPARVTAGASLAFLGLNVVTAGLVAGIALGTTAWPTSVPPVLGLLLVAACVVALLPVVVNRLGNLVAGRSGRLTLNYRAVGAMVVVMALAWTSYAGAVFALAPRHPASLMATAVGAFALSYVVGVVVVVAPAGVGAREVTLVALLAPVIGVAPASAVSVLTRLLQTAADLLLALVAWALARRGASAGVGGAASRVSSGTDSL